MCLWFAISYLQHFDLKREFPGDKTEHLKVREAASGGVFVVSGEGGGRIGIEDVHIPPSLLELLSCSHDLYYITQPKV